MFSIDRLKEMALEDIENNSEKHLEEYAELLQQLDQLKKDNEQLKKYRSALEEIREDVEQDTTCESRECGCDDYAECLNCIKETILNKISEVENV